MTGSLLALLLAACTPDPTAPAEPAELAEPTDDTRGAPEAFVSSPTTVASEVVPTVFEVRFETTAAGTSWVEVTDATGTWQSPSLVGQTHHEHTLLGLKAGQQVTWRAAVEGPDGAMHYTEPEALEVPPPPWGMPEFVVVEHDPTRTTSERFFALTYLVGGNATPYAVLVDQDGDPVWWASPLDAAVAMVKPSLDGQALLLAHLREAEDGELGVYRVPLDAMGADEVTLTPADDGHHDFVELPDGTIAHLGDRHPLTDYGPDTDVVVKLDQIVEVTPDGERQVVFDVHDDLPGAVQPTCSHNQATVDDGSLIATWGHANSLAFDASDDTYILHLRNLDMLLKVDRSGQVVWKMGGLQSEFEFSGRPWDHGHFSDWRGTEFGMFSNGLHEGAARAIWYEVDAATGQVHTQWSYDHPEGERINALGDVDQLPGGHMFVAWGPGGAIDEITRGGEVVWRIETVPETILARVDWFADLYDLNRDRR